MIKIVSGGQTGVDRAALGVAMLLGLPCGGWCPRGRRAEDGAIPVVYPLRETPSTSYPQRTEWNIRDSDATLILYQGALSGGTRLTRALAQRLGRPWMTVDLNMPVLPEVVVDWLEVHRVTVLNVAGPRESERPGVAQQAASFLTQLLAPEAGR